MQAEYDEKTRLREATTIITIGGFTNAILSAAKIVLGNFTGYLPLIASGLHSLSDIVSDVIAWVAVLIGSQSEEDCEDLRFHYGRRRIETLLSLFAAFFLAYVSVELIMDAFGYHGHEHPVDRDEGGLKSCVRIIAIFSFHNAKKHFAALPGQGHRLTVPSDCESMAYLLMLPVRWRSFAYYCLSYFFFSGVDPDYTIVVASLILRSAWEVGMPRLKS